MPRLMVHILLAFFFLGLISALPLVQRNNIEVADDTLLQDGIYDLDFDKRDPESPYWFDVPESLRFKPELPRTDRKSQLDEEMILSARRHPMPIV
ncbi:unnamed protein product, partial [Mesorhabditis spiculigera]